MLKKKKNNGKEIPWQSSGKDSVLSLVRARVRSLVGKLRSLGQKQTNKQTKMVSTYCLKPMRVHPWMLGGVNPTNMNEETIVEEEIRCPVFSEFTH